MCFMVSAEAKNGMQGSFFFFFFFFELGITCFLIAHKLILSEGMEAGLVAVAEATYSMWVGMTDEVVKLGESASDWKKPCLLKWKG